MSNTVFKANFLSHWKIYGNESLWLLELIWDFKQTHMSVMVRCHKTLVIFVVGYSTEHGGFRVTGTFHSGPLQLITKSQLHRCPQMTSNLF